MDTPPPPLLLGRADPDVISDGWRRRAAQVLGAAAIHLLPLAVLVSALPLKPSDLGGAFGPSVSVTLVSGTPQPATPPAQPTASSLAHLEQRLSDHGLAVAEPSSAPQSSSPTRLSDLFEPQSGVTGASAARGPARPNTGGDDDPFSRASVSYRGDDPQKIARLRSRAQGCARNAKLRLLLIINSEGYLVARPRLLGTTGADKAVSSTISAIERCAPFPDAASPGPPRSYEIDLG